MLAAGCAIGALLLLAFVGLSGLTTFMLRSTLQSAEAGPQEARRRR